MTETDYKGRRRSSTAGKEKKAGADGQSLAIEATVWMLSLAVLTMSSTICLAERISSIEPATVPILRRQRMRNVSQKTSCINLDETRRRGRTASSGPGATSLGGS